MKNTDHLIDKTLESLDEVQRAEANPYLFTRLQQKMKNRSSQEFVYKRKLMPVLAVALVLFISVNVLSYYRLGTAAYEKGGSTIENFAIEYNLSEQSGL